MEPNKLENQFREKLNNRKINPSEAAWDRLDAMLSITDQSDSEQANQKPKRRFTWLYVAASIAGFLLVGTIFFNQKESAVSVDKNEVVIHNEVIPKTETIPVTKENAENNEPKMAIKNTRIALENNKAKSENQKTKVAIKKDRVAENNVNQSQKNAHSIISQETEQQSITPERNDVNVDKMLAAVEKTPKKISDEKSVSVNAANLLSQVDGELKLSFREKVISKVNKNYQSVKVALANRNRSEE